MNRAATYSLSVLILTLTAAPAGAAPAESMYAVRKLALPGDVLPSCMAVRPDGTLVVGSMDGHVLLVVDSDRDRIPDRYERWAGTIPHWPLGMRAEGDDVLVAARGSLLRLSDRDRDGWAEQWQSLSDAWDVSRDHHDWTTGIAPYPGGGWVVGPATDDVRSRDVLGRHFLRGKAVHVAPDGKSSVLAEGLRYTTGWAARPGDGAVFFTDNQGQQKTTCEINRLVPGGWYGYPSQADTLSPGRSVVPPSVRIPYPWARSVNGLEFVNASGRFGPIDGQLILCEYNNRFILRASLEDVDGQTQGACYPFVNDLLGPVCLAFTPDGVLYVGSLREPAWGAEPEQGAIYRISFSGHAAFGIQHIKAERQGFTIGFFTPPADRAAASDPERYQLRRYHHVFQGAYHSPPVDEESLHVASAVLSADGRSVRLTLKEPHVADRIYELHTTLLGADPAVAHYTMNRVPK